MHCATNYRVQNMKSIAKGKVKSLIRWECSHRRKYECLGALKTNIEITEIIGTADHNEFCEPEAHLATKAEVRQQLKQEALTVRGATKPCISKVLDPLPVAVRSEVDKGTLLFNAIFILFILNTMFHFPYSVLYIIFELCKI